NRHGYASQPSGARDCLPMIACRRCNNTAASCFRSEQPHLVGRTAYLERAHRLQVLTLQEHVASQHRGQSEARLKRGDGYLGTDGYVSLRDGIEQLAGHSLTLGG